MFFFRCTWSRFTSTVSKEVNFHLFSSQSTSTMWLDLTRPPPVPGCLRCVIGFLVILHQKTVNVLIRDVVSADLSYDGNILWRGHMDLPDHHLCPSSKNGTINLVSTVCDGSCGSFSHSHITTHRTREQLVKYLLASLPRRHQQTYLKSTHGAVPLLARGSFHKFVAVIRGSFMVSFFILFVIKEEFVWQMVMMMFWLVFQNVGTDVFIYFTRVNSPESAVNITALLFSLLSFSSFSPIPAQITLVGHLSTPRVRVCSHHLWSSSENGCLEYLTLASGCTY